MPSTPAPVTEPSRLARIARATVGLVVGGAISGSVVGVAWLGALALAVDGAGGFPYFWGAFTLAGIVGAALGAVVFPAVTWGFLRHVAFTRVVAYGAAGTVVGGTIGALATGLSPSTAVVGAIAGFLAATIVLRLRCPPYDARGRSAADD